MARVRSTIRIQGINPYVLVEAAVAEALRPGWRGPMPVIARLNGHPAEGWAINLMPIGDGRFHLFLRGDVRRLAGVDVGAAVEVELRFDESYVGGPTQPMPPGLEEALSARPDARGRWDALSPSRQTEIVRYFASLKSDEARSRNLVRVLDVLSGRPGRFMARDWNVKPADAPARSEDG